MSEAERSEGIMNDHELLAAYVQGDERAFDTLVERYFRMVYATAARQMGDFHLAEEVAQTVFLILSRKARGFSPRATVCGWLMQTTRFVCRDAIKMRRRQEKERELQAATEHTMQTTTESGALEALLDEALLTLKTEEHAGVFARFVEGKNFKEIGEMLAISEDTAQKRISRSLDKLRAFMVKRGARVPVSTVTGLLLGRSAHEATNRALQSALHSTLAFLKGKVTAANAVALADYMARSLTWRTVSKFALTFALPALVIVGAVSAIHKWSRPTVDSRLEKLGQAWGVVDRQVASMKQTLAATGPDDPAFLRQANAIGNEYTRLMAELGPLLAPPDERTHLAEFFIAELNEALNLDTSQKTALSSHLQSRLAQGATLNDAMKAIALAASTEANEVKAMLSPQQQQVFDRTYGADGMSLFAYAKAMTIHQIGPSAPQ